MKVLVVDDSMLSRMMVIKKISAAQSGLQIEQAGSGMEGILKFRSAKEKGEPFQWIFLDYMMPGKDGVSTLEDIRKEDATVKVVMITANSLASLQDKVMSLGCCGFLTKDGSDAELKRLFLES